jgi:hypothetical protein
VISALTSSNPVTLIRSVAINGDFRDMPALQIHGMC